MTKEAEESGDPAAVRAVRDKKFQRWLQSEVITAETRVARAKDTVAEARRLEDVKKNMPEGTLRADVEPTMAGIRGSQGLEAGDVRKNASQLLEGKLGFLSGVSLVTLALLKGSLAIVVTLVLIPDFYLRPILLTRKDEKNQDSPRAQKCCC